MSRMTEGEYPSSHNESDLFAGEFADPSPVRVRLPPMVTAIVIEQGEPAGDSSHLFATSGQRVHSRTPYVESVSDFSDVESFVTAETWLPPDEGPEHAEMLRQARLGKRVDRLEVGGEPPVEEVELRPRKPVVRLPPRDAYKGKPFKRHPPTFWKGFSLGRKILKGHVVREVLPLPVNPLDPLGVHGKQPLTFLERGWKAIHMRVGFFPRRDEGVVPTGSGLVDQKVHWSPTAGIKTARGELEKLAESTKYTPGVRKASEAPAGVRLRSRARWVLSLNPDKTNPFLGALLKGRWTPDLSCEFAPHDLARFVAAWGDRVKFLGGGILETTKTAELGTEQETLSHVYVHAEVNGSVVPIYPALLAKLSSYAAFRVRGPALVQALKVRATEWCKRNGFSEESTAETLAPSVAIAHHPSRVEASAMKLFQQESGAVEPPSANWWTAST